MLNWTYRNFGSKYRWNHLHYGLWFKPGTNLLDLNDKFEDTLRNMLSELTFILIHELAMTSVDL